MLEECKAISQHTEKPPDFIEQSIKLNKKNIEIVKILDQNLEFDRIRVNYLESLLTMKYIVPDPKIKDYYGAKHWAGYLNNKLKMKYVKS